MQLALVSCQTAGGAQVIDEREHVDNDMGKESNIWTGIIPEHLSVQAEAGIVREIQTRRLVVRLRHLLLNSSRYSLRLCEES